MSEANNSIVESEEPPSFTPPLAAASQQVLAAILSVPLLILVTGAGFPLLLAALARPLFPQQSEGSLVSESSHPVGSLCIGQPFSGRGYFHPRPSAAGSGYDVLASGGTNLSPANPRLRDGAPDDPVAGVEHSLGVRHLVEDYRRQNGLSSDVTVPIDAVTCSGSGLDPHISPANARLQLRRIVRARGLSEEQVHQLIDEHTHERQLGFLGEPRVSVLELNLALDRISSASAASSDH